jgi:tetratricopeptide (TPR) repeat protein
MQSAFDRGEWRGAVAVAESLLALDLPPEFLDIMRAELHDGLVVLGYGSESESEKADYWRRADAIARQLLASPTLPSDVLATAANFHAYSIGSAPPEELAQARGQWLPYELAVAAREREEGEPGQGTIYALDYTLGRALDGISERRGVDAAMAVTDSLLAQEPPPAIAAVIRANRYKIAVDEEPEVALEAARRFESGATAPGFWMLLNTLAFSLTARDLELPMALRFEQEALGFASSARDSGVVFNSLGRTYRALGRYGDSEDALRKAIASSGENAAFGDNTVQELLSVYEEAGDRDGEIDFLARLIARSALDNEEARAKLAELLNAEGRSTQEIPDLLKSYRYAGVKEAGDFTLLGADGAEVGLSDLRGRVALINFWSYG